MLLFTVRSMYNVYTVYLLVKLLLIIRHFIPQICLQILSLLMHKYAQELEMFLSIKFSGKILLNTFILLSLFIECTLPTPKYWSERSACDMCRQTQRPLLTLLRLSLSSSPVFTFLPEGIFLWFWILECKIDLKNFETKHKVHMFSLSLY